MMAEESWRDFPIGVIGAGCIGESVAHALAMNGMEVVLVDRAADALRRALDSVRGAVSMSRLLKSTAAELDEAQIRARITPTDDIANVRSCGVVIENVTERWDVKQSVYVELDRVCKAECVLIANTSCFPIDRLASATTRASNVVGIHFMNPVPLTAAAELIPARQSSARALTVARELLKALGKRAIVAPDRPGFISNRILMITINEAVRMVEDGSATPNAIDQVFRGCFGHKMGPLETADLIGLNTIKDSLDVLETLLGDERFRPSGLLAQMIAAGRTGCRAGEGFYRYAETKAQ